MTLQGMITRKTAEDFGLSTSTTPQTNTNPEITKWCEVVSEAISQNSALAQCYELEITKGYDFIRVNLRNRHNWSLIKNLIIIHIKQKIVYGQCPSYTKKVKKTVIIIEESNPFAGLNKTLANECVNKVVCSFLRDYIY